jgi:hypothetical protein
MALRKILSKSNPSGNPSSNGTSISSTTENLPYLGDATCPVYPCTTLAADRGLSSGDVEFKSCGYPGGAFEQTVSTDPRESEQFFEDEDIKQKKEEIRHIRDLDLQSTSNALEMGREALFVGSGTLETLQRQDDRLRNAASSLYQAEKTNDLAYGNLKELDHANHMISIRNPFRPSERKREVNTVLRKRRHDLARDDTSRCVTLNRNQSAEHEEVARYQKYLFEPDSDDEWYEDIVNNNLGELGKLAWELNKLARAQGEELERQNREEIDQLERTAVVVGNGVKKNRTRLDRY